MPYATFFEADDSTLTPFSFVVRIADDVWASMKDGTLPTMIPATVIEVPLVGAAKLLYRVLKVGNADLGPVRLLDAAVESGDSTEVIPLALGDVVTIHVLGRIPAAL